MMRKILLIWCFAFAALSVWADVFHPDSSHWVTVELHDRDKVSLDSAALYKFSQATDTVRNVLVVCKSPLSSDTIFSSLDITGLNVKDFKLTINARCNVHLQGDAVFSGTSSVGLAQCEAHIDADTLPELGSTGAKINIDRGAIPTIRGGICRIGENMTGRISIQSMNYPGKSYLFNGEITNINYPSQFIQEGGKVLGWYHYIQGGRNDTAVIINGGEVREIAKNSSAKIVVNGGVVQYINIFHGQPGNVILNGGVVTNSVWWQSPNKNGLHEDTIFIDNHAIIAMTGANNATFSNKNGVLRLDDIHSLTTISCNRPPILLYENKLGGDTIMHIEPSAIKQDGTYNMTEADSLLNWDVLTIYPSYQRIIHYQVPDGIAPKDTTYQEGIVRYFTTVPTRTYYNFMGWYADSLCTIRVDSLDEWSRGDTTLWAKWEHSHEIPSLSIMIAQGNCLAVRNPDGLSELDSAYYTWVHQDTIVVNGMDSIISDTLPSHKMYVEVGDPIPQGRYTAIIHIEEGWTVYVTRNFPATNASTSPHNSNQRTILHFGSHELLIDEEGRKYIVMP